MIDVAWMGRDTARDPITVKSARRIEHDAKWRKVKDRAIFAGTCLVLAVVVIGLVALWGCV